MMDKITEMFIEGNPDYDAERKNRLTKQLADLKLKKANLKSKYQKDGARIDRQIEIIQGKLRKL